MYIPQRFAKYMQLLKRAALAIGILNRCFSPRQSKQKPPHVIKTQRTFKAMGLLVSLCLTGLYLPEPAGAEAASNVVFTGSYRLRLQSSQVDGSLQQYKFDTGQQAGLKFTQNLALSGFGSLGQGWYFNGRFDDSLSVAERLELRINKAANELFAGTRRFAPPSSGLLQWGRLVTGLQTAAVTDDTRFGLRAAVGEPLGIPAHDELRGKGLVGPYLLAAYHIPVVPDSESVYLDGVPQKRGSQYEIDYELGGITFSEPVPEGALITVEYEYQAPQPRRISVMWGRWKESNFTLDLLAGEEHQLALQDDEDNPLIFVPSGSEEETLPTRQFMQGTALQWTPAPGLSFTGSWLGTATTSIADINQAAAWQTGAEWLGKLGKAGYDYRVIPKGFRPIGRSAEQSGYQAVSAGYEYRLAPSWHSKLNLLWRQALEAPVAGSRYTEGRAEHVLTHLSKYGTVGWIVGLEGKQQALTSARLLTTGVLGSTSIGAWDLEAERRGVLEGASQPGDLLVQSRLIANLARSPLYSGGVQWKQEVQASNSPQNERYTVWRATMASKNNSDNVLPDAHKASWRLQLLHSATELPTAQPTQVNASLLPTSLSYARAETTLPIGAQVSNNLVAEWRKRTGAGTDTRDLHLESTLRFNQQITWDVHSSLQSSMGANSTGRQQLAAGANWRLPTKGGWAYVGNVESVTDNTAVQKLAGMRSVQGLSWSRAAWQFATDWTKGLLQLPAKPGEDDTDTPPLAQLPVGQRFGLRIERVAKPAQFKLQLARDFEAQASVWRADMSASSKLGRSEVLAQLSVVERRGTNEWALRESGRLGVQWWVGENTLTSITGKGDIRASLAGVGDYRSLGLFTEWTTRF